MRFTQPVDNETTTDENMNLNLSSSYEFAGYSVCVTQDPVYYGSECTNEDAVRIAGNLSDMIYDKFPGIAVFQGGDPKRDVFGPDNEVSEKIAAWIAANWTAAL